MKPVRIFGVGLAIGIAATIFFACSSSDDSSASATSQNDAAAGDDANTKSDARISDAEAIALSISPNSLDFGSIVIHDASTRGVVITNGTSSAVSLAEPSISGHEFSVDAAGFPTSLAPGAHASLGIIFDPIEAGPTSGQLVVTPTGGTALDVALSGNGIHAVDVSWDASSTPGIAGYNLYRGTVPGGPYPDKINTALIPGTTYEDTNVMLCTTYYYVATAVEILDDGGQSESGYSNEYGAAIPCY
jgi:hypothetical protein